jgi:hypothetical protein
MIQALGCEDATTDESKVFVLIVEIAGNDLRMADGERFVFQDVRIQGTDIHVSLVSPLQYKEWHWSGLRTKLPGDSKDPEYRSFRQIVVARDSVVLGDRISAPIY